MAGFSESPSVDEHSWPSDWWLSLSCCAHIMISLISHNISVIISATWFLIFLIYSNIFLSPHIPICDFDFCKNLFTHQLTKKFSRKLKTKKRKKSLLRSNEIYQSRTVSRKRFVYYLGCLNRTEPGRESTLSNPRSSVGKLSIRRRRKNRNRSVTVEWVENIVQTKRTISTIKSINH